MLLDKSLKQGVSKLYLEIENACETSVVLFLCVQFEKCVWLDIPVYLIPYTYVSVFFKAAIETGG